MGAKQRGRSTLARTGAALWLLAAAGCSDGTAEALGDETSAIRDGSVVDDENPTTNALIAVYHRIGDSVDYPWDEHPCSGIMLNPSGLTDGYILTARHCVTVSDPGDDPVDGIPLSPSNIKVTGAYAPGLTPPFNALPACDLITPEVGSIDPNLSQTLDLAIIRTCKLIPDLHTTTVLSAPLFLGCSDELRNQTAKVYGYGCGFTNCMGAGILRVSGGHNIDGFPPDSPGLSGYDWNMFNLSKGDGGAYLDHGDSGGPSLVKMHGSGWMQVGVHGTGGSDLIDATDQVISRITMGWIQSVIGRIFIRPHGVLAEAVTRSGTQSGASLKTASTSYISSKGPTAVRDRQYFRYDFPSRHFFMPSSNGDQVTCLRRNGSDVDMVTCSNLTNQKWWVTGNSTISDSTQTICLERGSDSYLTLGTCSATKTSQKWYFDPDSKVPGVN